MDLFPVSIKEMIHKACRAKGRGQEIEPMFMENSLVPVSKSFKNGFSPQMLT
jgi:hypothetical protein